METRALRLVGGTASAHLTGPICRQLGVPADAGHVRRFPDGELDVSVSPDVRGADVFVTVATAEPVGDHVLELALLVDAARRGGAAHVTALVPYFGYARQDRRREAGQALGAAVLGRLVSALGLDRLVVLDLHSPALEASFACPVEHITAVPLLARELQPLAQGTSVIVSPDLGGVKLAEHYARILNLPLAIVHKTRRSGTEVTVHEVVGEVRGKRPIIVDDMVSTGKTLVAAVEALRARGCVDDVRTVATHGLFTGRALDDLRGLGVGRVLCTDSVRSDDDGSGVVRRVSLAPLLATVVQRLHEGGSLAELLSRR